MNRETMSARSWPVGERSSSFTPHSGTSWMMVSTSSAAAIRSASDRLSGYGVNWPSVSVLTGHSLSVGATPAGLPVGRGDGTGPLHLHLAADLVAERRGDLVRVDDHGALVLAASGRG